MESYPFLFLGLTMYIRYQASYKNIITENKLHRCKKVHNCEYEEYYAGNLTIQTISSFHILTFKKAKVQKNNYISGSQFSLFTYVLLRGKEVFLLL